MKFSLSFILAVSLAGLQFLVIGIVLSTSYLSSEKAMLHHARDLLEKAGANASEHTSGFLKPASESAELAKRVFESGIIDKDDFEQLEAFLFQVLQNQSQISGIYYGDEAGNFTYVMRDDGAGPFRSKFIRAQDDLPGADFSWRKADYSIVETATDPADTFDPRGRPWYKTVKEQRSTIWTDPYIFFSSRQPGTTVAVPVEVDGVLSGVVGVDIEISEISSFLSQLDLSENASALILDEGGKVVAHPNMAEIIDTETGAPLRLREIGEIGDPISQAAFARLGAAEVLQIGEETQSEFEYEKDKYVSLLKPLSSIGLPWTIAVFAPETDFTQVIKDNRTRNLWIAAIISCIAALVGFALAELILRPVRVFAVRTALVSQGEVPDTEALPATYRELEKANETLIDQIAQRRQADARIIDLNRDLSHFSRVNLMGQMATGLAHELSQPLTAISQNVDAAISTARQDENPNEDLLNILNELDDQAHRGGDILSALRGFIRKDQGQMAPFDVNELVKQTESLLLHEAFVQGVTLRFEVDQMPQVVGNRIQIAQVLTNLVRNALEAISSADSPKKEISVTAERMQNQIEIWVKDTGPGIAPDVTLFKQFETSKKDGMGLGLSISRTLAEANGGRLWCDTSSTHGASFCLSLPI
ncbi:cache domain-containing protein [Sulfitobacter donghicola]|uniref:histidine kinase n=1 Tax=Sulfitobacter donghicola DSW-25 = KCTC 12864 = JCM 14565 TaxID=1300350 RepID=A0A073IHI5_9RHOB|nr:cache domain-containing protein [Sulfitobacter donghicola]KEJ88966.1 histidine kinase [Sulfitobacter donghicola DSW-25 = KCTC 12864 = JCM 14565]KIN67484.1 Sensor transduction histidine kinase [Sulfitobacter donghicola DSW-25 = KCTC 12864 = JCM 14565]